MELLVPYRFVYKVQVNFCGDILWMKLLAHLKTGFGAQQEFVNLRECNP